MICRSCKLEIEIEDGCFVDSEMNSDTFGESFCDIKCFNAFKTVAKSQIKTCNGTMSYCNDNIYTDDRTLTNNYLSKRTAT